MSGRQVGNGDEVEALVVDRYLESLLARRPFDAGGVPPELDGAAQRLTQVLPRFHPSFHFEEGLALRLATAAGEHRDATIIPLPLAAGPAGLDAPDRSALRPVVIGSVVTSAAISIAGAAFVAWRRTHPTDTMARAVRAVARARIA